MALQAITDRRTSEFERAVREVDFIKRYVFPGSFIPSTTAIVAAAAKASDLRLRHLEDIGAALRDDTARVARELHRNADAIRALGYDDAFLRLWEFYLCYCEGGFAERFLGVGQFRSTRPLARLSGRSSRIRTVQHPRTSRCSSSAGSRACSAAPATTRGSVPRARR